MSADASELRQALIRWSSGVAGEAGGETVRLVRQDRRVPNGPPRPAGGAKLRESINMRGVRSAGSSTVVEMEAKGWGAVTTDRGSRPHVILPRRARVLRFESGGMTVFARRVNHPGTRAKNWWEPVLRDAWPRALRAASGKVRF